MSHSALTVPSDFRSASRSLLLLHLTTSTDKLSLFDVFDPPASQITINLQVLDLRMQPSLHTSSHVIPYCQFLKMFLKCFRGTRLVTFTLYRAHHAPAVESPASFEYLHSA